MMVLVLALGLAAPPRNILYREALDLLYDGSTDTALSQLGALAAASPDDPLGAYLEALGLAWKVEQRPESTALDKELLRRVDHAIAVADERLREDPVDARALLARGGAHGVRSRLHLFRVQKREAADAAVRMRRDLLRLLELDPGNKDALFGLGLYDYYADVLPRLAKVVRFLARIPGGDRERGLARIEEGKGSWLHGAEAQVQLYIIYAFYEEKPDRALEEIVDLRKRFPGSPLWGLQLAEHERDRLGLYARSAAVAREVLEARERQAPNYAGVVAAMARLSLGESLLLDLRLAEARRALLEVKDGVPEAPWLAPKAHLLLGRSLELEGDRDGALVHYRLAAAAPDRELRRRARTAVASPIPAAEVRAAHPVAEARRLRESGRTRESAEAYREALAAWPDCQEAALRVAEEEMRRGHAGLAREALQRLASRERTSPPWVRVWSVLLLARLHDLAGEREAAVNAYKEVFEAPWGQAELREAAAAGLQRPYAAEGASRGGAHRFDHSR